MDSYVVRRERPQEVRTELEALWQRNLPIEQSAASKFEWLYQAAPLHNQDVFLLRGGSPEHAVGTAGVVVRELYVGSSSGARPEVLRAGVLADVAVDREHRTLGPAMRLVREARAWALEALDLTYGLPNPHAQGVVRRVGYSVLGPMTRYARALRHAHYLDRLSDDDLQRLPAWSRGAARALLERGGVLRQAAATSLDLAMLARELPQVAQASRRWSCAASEQLPAGVGALFARCRGEYDLVSVRSDALLAWRYPPRPGRLYVSARSGSRLDAYAVIETVGDLCHVRDLFGARDALAALLPWVLYECYRRGGAAVSMRFLGEPWLVGLLEKLHFEKRGADRAVHLSVSSRITGPLRDRLLEPQCWYFTDFDEDV